MRHTKKSKRQFRKRQLRDIIYISFISVVIATIGWNIRHTKITIASPIGKVVAEDTSPTPQITPMVLAYYDSNASPTQEQVEAYIRRIFTDQADTAIAISHAECGPTNNQYPACVLHTDAEYSVGIFQINLYNAQQNIHADRIPGTTMDEKIAWLKNPFNNTLYAWWVYSTSGFTPWSTYQSGAYLQ